jgi:hypothetical protein
LTLITRGKFEWNGDWSDKSALWNQHPQIKFEMGFSNSGCCPAMLALHPISLLPPRPSLSVSVSWPLCWLLSSVPDKHDDGIFYMSWNDFVKYFNSVDVCYTQKDLSYLQLNIYESFNVFGPFIGCLIGESLFLFVADFPPRMLQVLGLLLWVLLSLVLEADSKSKKSYPTLRRKNCS